jgi:RNA polymerase sigma factor (sigma-70 family)
MPSAGQPLGSTRRQPSWGGHLARQDTLTGTRPRGRSGGGPPPSSSDRRDQGRRLPVATGACIRERFGACGAFEQGVTGGYRDLDGPAGDLAEHRSAVRSSTHSVARESQHSVPLDRPYGEDGLPLAETYGRLDTELDHVERHAVLRPLIEARPARERTILTLRFFEDLTPTRIAERVGLSQMHVSRLLSTTLAQLRQQLADAGNPITL